MALPAPISKLDTTVINRIAAGEVIQRPANALKEMLENSLDAKATNIQINVKDGGMKLLQITDNGTGIRKEDLEIVCERFTTSKLREFEDLKSISTYGFRGEGLASISHVARLTIITKTAASQCAYKASYNDGKLTGPPKPCAGNQGTQIIVEDLFYNLNTRRKALKTTYEEHAKIAEVVGSYAIHNSSVGFCLKKVGDGAACIRTQTKSSVVENICAVHGNSVARELLEVSTEDDKLQFKMVGQITNANYSTRKLIFLLFINHRLVDSAGIRKIIAQVYGAYLPKGGHPFVYLSLEINPNNVDVNVHPTKHQVFFLHEEEIIGKIREALENRLADCNYSRVFYTQARLPSNKPVLESKENESGTSKPESGRQEGYQKEMVRTDSAQQKLHRFLSHDSAADISKEDAKEEKTSNLDKKKKEEKLHAKHPGWREIKLSSVLTLQKMIEDDCHASLRGVFRDHSFVGCISPGRALIQHHTSLYLCNTWQLANELFYQIMMYQFGNFGMIKFSQPLSIAELALIGLKSEDSGWTEADEPQEKMASAVAQLLLERADMLLDYFSIKIDGDASLLGIPILLDGVFPCIEYLPMWILRLASEINWAEERECFESLCRETSKLYAYSFRASSSDDQDSDVDDESGDPDLRKKEKDSSLSQDISDSQSSEPRTSKGTQDEKISKELDSKKNKWKYIVEHTLYAAFRKTLLPPKHFAKDGTVLQIADLPNLYKVFERC